MSVCVLCSSNVQIFANHGSLCHHLEFTSLHVGSEIKRFQRLNRLVDMKFLTYDFKIQIPHVSDNSWLINNYEASKVKILDANPSSLILLL